MSTVLLADDSLTIQKVVELTFADTEHSVVAVSGGDELLQKLATVRPDVVICDVIMPGRDGYDVCQQIKSEPSTLHIPVVLLTGTFEPFDRDRALAAGCSEIITKPFEARKLVETVERLLQSAPAEGPAADTGPVAPQPPSFEGQVTPPAEAVMASAPPEPVPQTEPPVEEFGTQLAPPPAKDAEAEADEDALEFTSTGFDEMEAAGQLETDPGFEPPEEGIEFDEEDLEAPAPADAGVPEEAVAAEAAPEETGQPSALVQPEVELQVAAAQEPITDEVSTEAEAPAEPAPAQEEPEPSSPAPPHDVGDHPAQQAEARAEPTAGTPPVDFQPEPEAPPFIEQATEPEPAEMSTTATQPGVPLTTAAMPMPEVEPPPAVQEEEVAPPPPSPVPEAPIAPSGALTDEDVDRIARRVLELAQDMFEKIAWDVVPDMAEVVVRERIRQLEAEVDGQEPS